MTSAASRIPPELFAGILFHVGIHDERIQAKRHLSACSLTCRYWAIQCRWRIFDSVTLRSLDDVQTLRGFTLHPPPGFPSILAHLDRIVAEIRFTHGVPWLHHLHIFLQSQGLETGGYLMTGGRPEAFRRRDRIFVTLHICGLPSSVVARGQRPQVMRRILSTALPRPLPAVSRLGNSLTLDDMEIDGAANLIGLLQCIQFDKSTNTLQQLSFRNVKLKNPAEIDDLFVFFMQWPEFIGLSCTGCVDAISLLWVSFSHLCTLWSQPAYLRNPCLSIEENRSLLRICDALLRGSSSTEPYSPFLFARRATRSWPLPDSGRFFLEHSLEVYTRTVDTYPYSPIFFFYTTPFDRDESREQHVISSLVIEISVLDGSVASVYDTVIPAYDWEEIGAALHGLKPFVVITLNCHSYSQFIQFCEAQQRLNFLKTLDSRFTLEVRYVDSCEQPMDESRSKQVEDLRSLLDSMGEHVSVQHNTR